MNCNVNWMERPHGSLLGLCFAVLWGAGLWAVLEVDVLPLQMFTISAVALVSFGLDRVFHKW